LSTPTAADAPPAPGVSPPVPDADDDGCTGSPIDGNQPNIKMPRQK
jgi:hypothetical protein